MPEPPWGSTLYNSHGGSIAKTVSRQSNGHNIYVKQLCASSVCPHPTTHHQKCSNTRPTVSHMLEARPNNNAAVCT